MQIDQFFKAAIDNKASDLHLVAGTAPALRLNGELISMEGQAVLDNKELETAVAAMVGEDKMANFQFKKELDVGQEFFGYRFRVNLHYQRGLIGLTARLIHEQVPTAGDISLGDTLTNMTRMRDGLILVTGPTGCGKSTTIATMLNIINQERRAHIITIEDPIEYAFKNDKCLIEQREIGTDTLNFASALRSVLRQDPNVIMVGEMRDQETMFAAMTAAETGHLVFSTLHSINAADSIARITDAFPEHQRDQISAQLSLTLRAVVSQQLLPKVNGGLVAAREIMINNAAASNLIRRNQVSQIPTVIQTSSQDGMISMNNAIDQLVLNGLVEAKISRAHKGNIETKTGM